MIVGYSSMRQTAFLFLNGDNRAGFERGSSFQRRL